VLSLIPPAALLGFANVVAEDGARLGYAAVFLAAALAVLFSSGVLQLGAWGPILPPRRGTVLHVASGPAGRLARRLGVTAVVGAILAPGLLPGFGAAALVDLEGLGGDRVSISPLVDIRANLVQSPAQELLTVQADLPAYWRLQALDAYTGRFWRTSKRRGGGATESSALRYPPGLQGTTIIQRFELRRLGGSVLPAAYRPVEVGASNLHILHDPDGMVLSAAGGIPDGRVRYSVRSVVPAPTAADLDRPFDFSGTDPRYRELPEDTPPEILAAARELTRGATTPFRQALAIQNYLRGFVYDLDVAVGHSIEDIVSFLRIQRGYCQQFSATMAVLLRALGYPARVAVGFLPGAPDEDGVYHVTTEQAHAWTEMFFPGHGWLAFEPTPTRNNPAAAYLQAPPAFPQLPEAGRQGEVGQVGSAGQGPQLGGQLGNVERRFTGSGAPRRLQALLEEDRGPGWPPWLRALVAGIALVPILLVGIPLMKWARRRRRLRRARSPRALVLAAYEVLEDRAEDLGLQRRPHETPEEYGRRLRGAVRLSDGHLERLTALTVRAAYTPIVVSLADGAEALRAARLVGGDLRRHVGPGRAILAALRPFPPE
jgi:transglutaminase-like putative cysteine protease